MHEIKLTFTVDEVNTILNALGKQPYMEVSGLINKIQQQASPQVQASNGEKEAPVKDLKKA